MPGKKTSASAGDGAEKRDNKNEKNSGKKDDFANKMWKKINKSVSKDKIKDLKGEIKAEDKSKRKRKRRPKKKSEAGNNNAKVIEKKNDKQQPKSKTQFEPKVQAKQDLSQKEEKKSEQVETPAAPVNPFETPVQVTSSDKKEESSSIPHNPFAGDDAVNPFSANKEVDTSPKEQLAPAKENLKEVNQNNTEFSQSPSPVAPGNAPVNDSNSSSTKLPPRQYELSQNEDEDVAEDDNSDEYDGPEEAVVQKNAEPINPFDSYKPSPNLEKKALDGKPLDRKKEQEVKAVEIENVDEPSPEEKKHADEKISMSSEKSSTVESGSSERSEVSEGPMAEVREVGTESVPQNNHQELAGHAEPPVVNNVPGKEAKKDEFKEEFWSILAQAGITKGTIIKIIVVIVVIVIGIISFGTIKNLIFGGDDSVDTVVEHNDSEALGIVSGKTTDTERLPLPESIKESQAFPIVSSYIFGLEHRRSGFTPITALPIGEWGVDNGVIAAFALGGVVEPYKAKISYYADVLRRMDNMYNTDVYALLDNSVDRRSALEAHLEQLAALIEEADGVFLEIEEAMGNFDRVYESTTIDRDLYEEEFFLSTQELRGIDSYDNLELFVQSSQEAMRIKAYYNGYKMIGEMVAVSLDQLEPRFDDISSNTEALIKGLRVFDIPSSDIEAIIPVTVDEL